MNPDKSEQQVDKYRAEIEALRAEWREADDFCALKDFNEENNNVLIKLLEERKKATEQLLIDINMWISPQEAGDKIVEYNRGQAILQFIREFEKKICNSEKTRSIVEQSIKPKLKQIQQLSENSGEFSRLTGSNSPETKG